MANLDGERGRGIKVGRKFWSTLLYFTPSKIAIEKGILAKGVSRRHQQKQKASNVKMLHYEECDQLAHLLDNALECT